MVQNSCTEDGSDLTITLKNFVTTAPMKRMWLEMFFNSPVPFDALEYNISAYDPTGDVQVICVGNSGPGTSNTHYFDFEIFPSPDWEQIVLYGNAGANTLPGNLWKVEIFTTCVPEPGTIGLLVIGGLALLRRKRRS